MVIIASKPKLAIVNVAANENVSLPKLSCVALVISGNSSDNTLTLPSCSVSIGVEINVYLKTDGGNNAVITRAGSDVIQNGSADLSNTTVTLNDAGDFVTLLCVSSTEWQVIINNGGVVA